MLSDDCILFDTIKFSSMYACEDIALKSFLEVNLIISSIFNNFFKKGSEVAINYFIGSATKQFFACKKMVEGTLDIIDDFNTFDISTQNTFHASNNATENLLINLLVTDSTVQNSKKSLYFTIFI